MEEDLEKSFRDRMDLLNAKKGERVYLTEFCKPYYDDLPAGRWDMLNKRGTSFLQTCFQNGRLRRALKDEGKKIGQMACYYTTGKTGGWEKQPEQLTERRNRDYIDDHEMRLRAVEDELARLKKSLGE